MAPESDRPDRAPAVPWYIVVLVTAIFSSAIGGPWDISWQMTIGRVRFGRRRTWPSISAGAHGGFRLRMARDSHHVFCSGIRGGGLR